MENRRHRPRALTITLPDSKQPYLLLGGKRYTLRNFSEEGIGLWILPPLPFGLSPGTRVTADLAVGNQIHAVELEIVHYSPRIIGLRIVNAPKELTGTLSALLKPAYHGSELIAHEKNLSTDGETGFKRLWYHSPTGSELLIWYQEAQRTIEALQLCWLGKWVYRKAFEDPRTGYLRDGWGIGQGHVMNSADLLMIHPKPDARLLQEAAQVLSSAAPPLPGLKLWQFLEMGEQTHLPLEVFTSKKVA